VKCKKERPREEWTHCVERRGGEFLVKKKNDLGVGAGGREGNKGVGREKEK